MTIRKEALPYALFFGLCAALPVATGSYLFSILPALLFLFTLFFFRDPERVFDGPSSFLLSPADGRIIKAEEKDGEVFISIFMNVFNVHVNRAPQAGRISRSEYFPGTYLAAYKDKASTENERLRWVVDGEWGEVEFTQIAGLVARRIHPIRKEGDIVERAGRVGLIAFGSRVDVRFPGGGSDMLVKVGQKVNAGLTPLARRR